VLTGTPTVADQILKGEFENIKATMEKSASAGMQTFDSALLSLYQEGRISLDEALKNADSANNLRLKIKLAAGVVAGQGENSGGLSLSMEEDGMVDEE
jgi:twitching motility protein PilU